MVVLGRLGWLKKQVVTLQSTAHASYNHETDTEKIKFLGHGQKRGVMVNNAAVMLLLEYIEVECKSGHKAVCDKGHRHSCGTSEVSFYLKPANLPRTADLVANDQVPPYMVRMSPYIQPVMALSLGLLITTLFCGWWAMEGDGWW